MHPYATTRVLFCAVEKIANKSILWRKEDFSQQARTNFPGKNRIPDLKPDVK